MIVLIALAAAGLFAAGATAGIIGVVAVAIRREEKNLTLTSGATDNVTLAGRRLNGVYVRVPHPAGAASRRAAVARPTSSRPAPARPAALPTHRRVALNAVTGRDW
jgi:hypothetical protein